MNSLNEYELSFTYFLYFVPKINTFMFPLQNINNTRLYFAADWLYVVAYRLRNIQGEICLAFAFRTRSNSWPTHSGLVAEMCI